VASEPDDNYFARPVRGSIPARYHGLWIIMIELEQTFLNVSDLRHHLWACHLRHFEVCEYQFDIVQMLLENLEALFTIGRNDNLVVLACLTATVQGQSHQLRHYHLDEVIVIY
jgi:hypothetical protein